MGPARRRRPVISVVVPAHNEEGVLGRCLDAMLGDAGPGEIEVVVVCNGCTDGTARVAGDHGPDVRVVETPVASKHNALNLGDEHARGFPRFYVDADVEVSTTTVRLVAETLETGAALAASPRARFEMGGRPRSVKAYYRIWSSLPAVAGDMVGCGVYAMSEAGRRRFGSFPDAIADDMYVRRQFTAAERRQVPEGEVVVQSPRTLRALVDRKTRVFTGNLELQRRGLAGTREAAEGRWYSVVARRPDLLTAVPAYVAVTVVAKLRARRNIRRGDLRSWGRDETARVPFDSPG